MKTFTFALTVLLLFAASCPKAFGQAAVEYGLGAAGAATAATSARAAGNGAKAVFEKLNQTVAPEADAASSITAPGRASQPKSSHAANSSTGRAGAKPRATVRAEEPPKVTYEDPRQIQAGLDYDEMVRRFGSPSMSITTEAGKRAVSYPTSSGMLQVEVQDGKVVSIGGR